MNNKTILFVEDEKVLAKIIKESLESEGFRVLHAIQGQDGLLTFKNNSIHLCLLDVMMPVMDGFTLGKKIRELDPDIPIIFLTAKSTTQDVLDGFSAGGNDYLRKPFSMQELLARIENLLLMTSAKKNDQQDQHTGIIDIGRFNYNPINQLLEIDGSGSSLSYREHELLMKLIEAGQAIVHRRDILNDIWGDDSFFHSRNLDVYIRKLRKYFEADDKIQIITLKGVGYRFVF